MKVDAELGLRRVILENSDVRVQVLPEVGSKIISLMYVPGGHEFIFPPPEPEKGYQVPGYGTQFKDFDNSGFDECIPTVGACRYPGKAFQVDLPDHGEVWSVPWEWDAAGEALELRRAGTRLPFIFYKTLRLDGPVLRTSYKVENTSPEEIIYIWSSHPLLGIRPGDRVMVPPEVREVFIDQSHTGRLGGWGDRCSWPVATDKDGRRVDLSVMQPPSANVAEKYFTPRLSQGWCALDSPAGGHSMTFRFDPRLVPFVGMWINQGGWPVHSQHKHYCIALEPCNGAPDSLEHAVAMKQANMLGPKQSASWDVEIELRQGPPQV